MRRITKPSQIKPSEITPEAIFMDRRKVLKSAVAAGLLPGTLTQAAQIPSDGEFTNVREWPESVSEEAEFLGGHYQLQQLLRVRHRERGSGAQRAHARHDPWSVEDRPARRTIPATCTLEDLLAPHTLEERIYRLRCVEAWSMVIPWVGIPLGDVLKRFAPTSNAKFVEFNAARPGADAGPDAAACSTGPTGRGCASTKPMHPLRSCAVGMYGRCCRTRTARRCDWSCPGNTASRASSRS